MHIIKSRYPVTNCVNSNWISDKDFADCSEKQRDKKREFRKLLKITSTNGEKLVKQGFDIIFNSTPDENWQFCAIAFSLRNIRMYRSGESISNEMV